MSHLLNGKASINNTDHASKTKQMSETLWSEPPPMEKLNWLIHLQHVRGETDLCKELIKLEITKTNGKNEYAHYKDGIILYEEGNIQEALESFQLCHKLNPENVINIKEIAKCLYILRRYRLSLEAYMEAEKNANKPDWEIYHNIGQCLLHLGDVEKAREYASRAVRLGKQESSYVLLITILIQEGDLRSAVSACNTAIESCPDSLKMLTDSGILYMKLGQTQLAFERLSSALALEPTHYKALLGIGCITQYHEEYDVALSKYKIAIQTEPDSISLWNNIGMCFFAKQKYIAAISCLKRALWLSPLNWKILQNLGLVYLTISQPASAFNFLCAAVNLRPDVGISFMLLGCALLELKDIENGVEALKQSVILSPNDTLVMINAAYFMLKSERYNEAIHFIKHFDNSNIGKEDTTIINKELQVMRDNILSKIPEDYLKHFNEEMQPSDQRTQEETLKNNVTEDNINEKDAPSVGFNSLNNESSTIGNVNLESDEV